MEKPKIPIDEVKPIAERVPREVDGVLVFDLGTREARAEGDPAIVRAVLERCNGRATVAGIAAEIASETASEADIRGLIEALLEAEVVTDCAEHWRHFHRISSIDAGIVRRPSDEAMVSLLTERFVPTRLAGRGEALRPRRTPVWELAGRRASSEPQGGQRTVSFEELSTVLSAIYGRSEAGNHPIPSGGGIYSLAIHVLLRRELAVGRGPELLEPGLWWYDPDQFELRLVRQHPLELDGLFLSQPGPDQIVSFAHPVIFISADLERPSRKYSGRGYRFAMMEVGAALQSAYLVCTELELPIRPIGGVIDGPVRRFLELPADCHPLVAVLLGS
ncbi:MAG: SagB family peptide dehydrogenase [Actinomycetota bacterium]